MKTTPCLISVFGLTLLASAANDDKWVNFITQHQIQDGITWHMNNVANEGENQTSREQIVEGGALFQLWTIDSDAAPSLALNDKAEGVYMLDQALVGAYMPEAEITITAGDSYEGHPRTRADQPFTVEIEIDKLLSGDKIPNAAKQVLFEHHLASYSGGRTSIAPEEAKGGTPHRDFIIHNNGTLTERNRISVLPGADFTKVSGEEHFVIHALPDQEIPQTELTSSSIIIWPVASGRFEGLEANTVIRHRAPEITLHLDDLYPDSTTYLQVYKGSAVLGMKGKILPSTRKVLDQRDAESFVLTIEDADWADVFESDGEHTLEIIHITPFGTERLAHHGLMVNRELSINGTLNHMEASD